jgi:competence protein ComEC
LTINKGKARSRAHALPDAVAGAQTGRAHGGVAFGAGLLAHLGALAAAEAGPGRLFPWIPVAFGAGIVLYFTAAHEPMLAAASTAAGALCLAAFFARRRGAAFVALALVAAVAAGFAVATLRTARVAHVILDRPLAGVTVSGFVESREFRERTDRFVLRVTSLQSGRSVPQLERVRLSVRKGAVPDVGSHVTFKARLSPPLQPLRPGSYDFARDLYFQGIGASGIVHGTIRAEPSATAKPGWWVGYSALIHAMRDRIDERIRVAAAGDARAIATALLTGRRDAISTPVNDAMFISGLGHVLSISGYHMAVVAGVVFFVLRALLALVPGLAVERPIKKWAAFGALIAAAFYLLLSGAEVATQRSFLMTAVVLAGIMLDRRAITFRTLAIAALAVLLWSPESVVHPSFQMSFAATLGLVALVEQGMPKFMVLPHHWQTARIAHWGLKEIVALTLASLIAGLATTPYAAFHFHRITPHGVLANLAAMPVVSGWVMPAGILGLMAMPFGLDPLFWRLMAIGIDWMVAVAATIAALPGAIGRVPAFGTGPLLVMTAGMIVLALLKTRLRLAGVAVILVGVVWAARTPLPDMLVSADLRHAVVRAADGRLRLMRTGTDAFVVREWLAADADPRALDEASLTEGVGCDGAGCVQADPAGRLIAIARHPSAFADDCDRAALIVAQITPLPGCAARIVGRAMAAAHGAMMLRRTGTGYEVMAVVHSPGEQRPWGLPAARSNDAAERAGGSTRAGTNAEEARAPSSRPRQPVDATPADRDVDADE